MAHRQHEAVAVGPDGVLRVEAQEALPQGISHGSHGHGRARVAGVGLLHCVHRQGADGGDGLELGGVFPFGDRDGFSSHRYSLPG